MSGGPDGFREFHVPLDWRVLNAVHGRFVDHPGTHDTIFKLDDAQVVFVIGMLLATALLAWYRPALRLAVATTFGGIVLAYGATMALKPLVDRGKPFLLGRLAAGQHPSAVFPEGPGAIWVALGVGMWDVCRPISIAAFLFALEDGLVQLARGSHWPSDLYAAWLLGLAGGLVGRAVLRRVSRPAAASPGS